MVKASDVVYKYYEVEFAVKHKKDGSKASFVEVSIGYEHDGVRYYFQKNLQGDVARIFNANGYLVARYVYDAWGNHTVYDADGNINTDANFIGNINPFRYNVGASFSLINQTKQKLRFYVYHPYAPIETAQKMPLQASIFLLVLRGYYYDVETGLYYLNTRYYDPFACRFINADDISYIEPETINGLNLYSYCLNNPVMYVDPTGHFSIGTFIKGLGNIITGVLAIGAGAIVLIGGAPVGMIIVAGITLTAGVLTLNNGITDTSESFSGYNYMSDGLFKGNTTAYNWYSGITGTEGKMTLQPGMELDRFGSQYGRFLTNPGTSASQLNLPFTNNLVLNHYKVLKPFKVATGIVDGGGGFQYFSWRSIKRLVSMGYLAVI